MVLSKGALLWLCNRLSEASDIRGKSFKSWRCRDASTFIYCSLKFNKYGRFVSVITVNEVSRKQYREIGGFPTRIATLKISSPKLHLWRERNYCTDAWLADFLSMMKYPPGMRSGIRHNRHGKASTTFSPEPFVSKIFQDKGERGLQSLKLSTEELEGLDIRMGGEETSSVELVSDQVDNGD
ncbi:hypothetical protein HAX54_046507 [Datura stramonium]|uniref:Uncharacterized protein n=1 Tax=Datura stramonium TaxID=4076 RepID=A0ABS8WJL4_DATST|nr:hypothetical protein [Datura stramonium]